MPILSGVPGGRLLDPLGQPRALDAEDLGAAAVQLGALAGHERRARHVALQAVHGFGRARTGCRRNGLSKWRAVVEAGHDAAVGLAAWRRRRRG